MSRYHAVDGWVWCEELQRPHTTDRCEGRTKRSAHLPLFTGPAPTPTTTWLTPVIDTWTAVMGTVPTRRTVMQMTQMGDVARNALGVVAFRHYLTAHTGDKSRYLDLHKFTSTWTQWINAPNGNAPAPSRYQPEGLPQWMRDAKAREREIRK